MYYYRSRITNSHVDYYPTIGSDMADFDASALAVQSVFSDPQLPAH
jgi:hypothetical protein